MAPLSIKLLLITYQRPLMLGKDVTMGIGSLVENPIKKLNTTDIGWGCTIRSGQMLLLNILHSKLGLLEEEVERLLVEDLSIQNICLKGEEIFSKGFGEWFSPGEVGHCMCEVMKSSKIIQCLTVDITSIPVNEIKKLLSKNEDDNIRRPLLLFLKVRFSSLSSIDFSTGQFIKNIMKYSSGICGGKGKSSFYFYDCYSPDDGNSEDFLLYLDPHVMVCSDVDGLSHRNWKWIMSSSDYSLPITSLNPSMLLSFLFKSLIDFENFIAANQNSPFLTFITEDHQHHQQWWPVQRETSKDDDDDESSDDF